MSAEGRSGVAPGAKVGSRPCPSGAVVMVLVRDVLKNAVALSIRAAVESLLLSRVNVGCSRLSLSFPVSGNTAVSSVISLELSTCWLTCGAFVFLAPPFEKQSPWGWGEYCVTRMPVEKGKGSRGKETGPLHSLRGRLL